MRKEKALIKEINDSEAINIAKNSQRDSLGHEIFEKAGNENKDKLYSLMRIRNNYCKEINELKQKLEDTTAQAASTVIITVFPPISVIIVNFVCFVVRLFYGLFNGEDGEFINASIDGKFFFVVSWLLLGCLAEYFLGKAYEKKCVIVISEKNRIIAEKEKEKSAVEVQVMRMLVEFGIHPKFSIFDVPPDDFE